MASRFPETTDPRTRRLFLQYTSGGLLALSLGCGNKEEEDLAPTPGDSGLFGADSGLGGDTGWPGGGNDSARPLSDTDVRDTGTVDPHDSANPHDSGVVDPSCEETPEDIEGPFYEEGVPERSNLDLYGHIAASFTFSGHVLNLDCRPLKGAVIEIWHADPDGEYDNASPQMRYRGYMRTDAKGAYAFQTVLPGRYLNGSEYRPRHIHVKIWAGKTERLTTQLYFEGDPYNESDAWYNPVTELPMTKESGGAYSSTYDFVIES